MFKQEIINQAIAHAKAEYPKESVGCIVGANYIKLENIHKQPETDFLVSDFELLKIGIDNIQAVLHSHPVKENEEPNLSPSIEDMRTQANFAIPFGIICCDNERHYPIVWFGGECDIAPLEGRKYHWAVHDCYTLCRDYYMVEYGIKIPAHISKWGWWNEDNVNDFYVEMFQCHPEIFREIPFSEAKKGDAFLVCRGRKSMRERKPSHAMIYIGNELVLHHPTSGGKYDDHCLSRIEPIHRHIKYITHTLRIKGVNDD